MQSKNSTIINFNFLQETAKLSRCIAHFLHTENLVYKHLQSMVRYQKLLTQLGILISVAILVFLKPNLVYFAIVWFIFLQFGL